MHPEETKNTFIFFVNSKSYRDFSEAIILKRLLSNSSVFRNQFLIINYWTACGTAQL